MGGYGRCMVTKLISIFTFAGVVAAGSVAYAINAQALKSETKAPVSVSTLDVRNNPAIIKPTKPAVVVTIPSPDVVADVEMPTAEPTIRNQPLVSATPESKRQYSEDPEIVTVIPAGGPTKTPAPIASPSRTSDPVLPSPPPGYKPGQNGDDEGDGEHEDWQDSHDSWEHDDD